jgi:hypothetical protein
VSEIPIHDTILYKGQVFISKRVKIGVPLGNVLTCSVIKFLRKILLHGDSESANGNGL